MKTFVVVSFAALCAAIGETFLSYGMRIIGEPNLTDINQLIKWFLTVIRSPYIYISIFFLCVFFILYLTALSWADLSFVLPLTALSFIFAAVFARLFLLEEVSLLRWVGTLVIIFGITLVALDHKKQATGHKLEDNSFKTQEINDEL